MKRWSLTVLVLLAGLAGCDRPGAGNSPPAATAAEAPKPPSITPEDWKKAFESTFIANKSDKPTSDDGVTTYGAKFTLGNGKQFISIMRRDAFRKTYFFFPPTLLSINISTNVHSYISVRENEMPVFLLSTYFHNRGGWLFMERLSVMVDGDIILEKDFPYPEVKRDASTIGIEESYDFALTKAQVEGLRKVADGKDVKIRLTGQKGYFSLPKNAVKDFVSDTGQALMIFDALSQSLEGKIPPQTGS